MKKRLMTFLNFLVNIYYGRNIKITTSNGKYYLRTTLGHPLKRYLANFEKYDRFLPFLSKAISKSVIDIGSNVGDTLVLIKSISNAEVICVEPDKNFLRYLRQNIERNQLPAVKLYPYPIASEYKVVGIEKNGLGSTSNMSASAGIPFQAGIPTKTFRDLLTDLSLDINSIGIIKSDTDGYDWDCLNSIADYFDLASRRINYPEFIFYEHQTYLNNLGRSDPDCRERQQWYQKSLERLAGHGYTHYYIFDNFGTMIHHTQHIGDLIGLADSEVRSKTGGRFLNYFLDVLITQPAAGAIVEKALHLQAVEKMVVD